MGIVPDESHHFAISREFSKSWWIPTDRPETYRYGNLGQKPNLFYWINGRALNFASLFFPSLNDFKQLFLLRMISVFYSLLSLLFLYLLARELIPSRWWPLLVVFLMTHTLMFVFISGGANYDNLNNLGCFAAVYFLVRVLRGKSFYPNSLGWMISIGVAALAKLTALPMIPVMALVWVVYIVRCRAQIDFRPRWNWKLASLSAVFGVLLALNIGLYGGNLVRYHTLSPACKQVLGEEACTQTFFAKRENPQLIRLTFAEVFERGYPNPLDWFLNFWSINMVYKVYGVATGYASYYPELILIFFRTWLIGVFLVGAHVAKKPSFVTGSLISILVFYTLVLLYTNYDSELITKFRHFAIQGRYIFPVIGVFYCLVAIALAAIPNRALRAGCVVFTLLLFLWGGPLVAFFRNHPVYYPYAAISTSKTAGEITSESDLAQDFISRCSGKVDRFELRFATFKRLNTQPVTVRLVELETGRVLEEYHIPGEKIVDIDWHLFPVSAVLQVDHEYRIELSSPDSSVGNAVSVWSSISDEYFDGRMFRGGVLVESDLAFRYRCVQPPFTNYFRITIGSGR